jgi:hypothetical protein
MAKAKQKGFDEKKGLRKEIGLIILTVLLTAILTILTTLYVSRYQHPSISIQRATTVSWDGPEKLSVSKIVLTNTNLTTIHNLKIPISNDAFVSEPTIVVDTFTKSSIEHTSYHSTIVISSLSANNHAIITIFGVLTNSVSVTITDDDLTIENAQVKADGPKVANVPFIGSIRADEGFSTSTTQVKMREILMQEIADSYVVNRFIAYAIGEAVESENTRIEIIPESKLFKISDKPQGVQPFTHEGSYLPGFNSELVVLGARDENGNIVGAITGFDRVEFSGKEKKGRLFIKYIDLMQYYFENYDSELTLEITTEDLPNSANTVNR